MSLIKIAEAQKTNKATVKALFRLAKTQYRQKDYAQSVQTLESLLTFEENHQSAQRLLKKARQQMMRQHKQEVKSPEQQIHHSQTQPKLQRSKVESNFDDIYDEMKTMYKEKEDKALSVFEDKVRTDLTLEKGKQLYEQKQYKDALLQFRKVLVIDFDNVVAGKYVDDIVKRMEFERKQQEEVKRQQIAAEKTELMQKKLNMPIGIIILRKPRHCFDKF